MQFKFTKVTTKQRKQRTFVPTKSERLLAMLEAGERGSMDYFAKKLKTTRDGVRSFIHALRVDGHQIFNRASEGYKNRTEYFLAKKGMPKNMVINKVHHSMKVPHGRHILEIS